MVKSKVYVKAQEFVGNPKEEDFKIIEQDVDENLKDEEILTEAVCISPDPYIRVFPTPVGSEFRAFQVAKVLKSKNSKYPTGSMVLQEIGWRTISKSKGEAVWYRCDDICPDQPISVATGALGMPGVTAHYGLTTICKPKAGETVMVSGAAGAVGSIVGQISKILGCRAIGSCGSDEKVEFAKSLGFDAVFNYKTQDWKTALKEAAPNGIDCYYDNVGGKMSSAVIEQMNIGGRIAVCGAVSAYNSEEVPQAPVVQLHFVFKCLTMTGLQVFNLQDKKGTYDILNQWIKEVGDFFVKLQHDKHMYFKGKIKTRETVTNGFENVPKAFMSMLKGGNIGKAVVML